MDAKLKKMAIMEIRTASVIYVECNRFLVTRLNVTGNYRCIHHLLCPTQSNNTDACLRNLGPPTPLRHATALIDSSSVDMLRVAVTTVTIAKTSPVGLRLEFNALEDNVFIQLG